MGITVSHVEQIDIVRNIMHTEYIDRPLSAAPAIERDGIPIIRQTAMRSDALHIAEILQQIDPVGAYHISVLNGVLFDDWPRQHSKFAYCRCGRRQRWRRPGTANSALLAQGPDGGFALQRGLSSLFRFCRQREQFVLYQQGGNASYTGFQCR
uniref:Uncharacterized protein n=1 Tax=Spongospora subterranea TaxID=70186 RepID=A0A0H5R912_9EUKA|eukprot:CRZ04874.1 hypothetical protein [Spongospora subterranea]